MGDKSKIEWCEATWNPIIGCSKVSSGCDNCYAETVAARFAGDCEIPGYYFDVIEKGKWNGETVRRTPKFSPLRARRPRTIFVCSMGDLFHESVPDESIDIVMGIIAAAYHHRFMILTKRPERMLQYFEADARNELIAKAAGFANENGDAVADFVLTQGLPIPSLALGVSVEDQTTLDKRVSALLQIPATYRFVSYEPALGPVRFDTNWRKMIKGKPAYPCTESYLFDLDLVIMGGESGPNARPMHPDWARSVRDQCEAARVPFHFKQWGEWLPTDDLPEMPKSFSMPWSDADTRGYVNLMSDLTTMTRIGKKKASRLLDGQEHTGQIRWR